MDKLTPEQQEMMRCLQLFWDAPGCSWDYHSAENYTPVVESIHARLEDQLGRELVLMFDGQDTHLMAQIPLPSSDGRYPRTDDGFRPSEETYQYYAAPVVVTFSLLGRLATIWDDANAEPALLDWTVNLLREHSVTYIPYSTTQELMPPFDGRYPESWYDAVFNYY